MNHCFSHLTNTLAVIFLLLELLSLQGAHACSQTDQCHNETLNPECQKSFPLNLSNHTTLTFCNGQIDIENDTVIRNVTDIHLTSFGDGRTELVCTRSAVGFKFFKVVNLRISSIVFDGCGLILGHEEIDYSRIITGGLVISHCKNVTLNNVSVQNSVGTGLIVNQTSGVIQIKNSSFDGNCKDESVLALAGGLYIEFTHHVDASEVTTVYYIDNCKFINNYCSVPSFTDDLGSFIKYQDFGEGGGVRLVFMHNASRNNITINNSTIFNNRALWGGGMHVRYSHSPKNNSLVFQNSHFVNNNCIYRGGGIDIGFEASYTENTQSSATWNSAEFQKCVVGENEAIQYGGGLRIYSRRNKFTVLKVTFSGCFFSKNKALYGPAVNMLPDSVDIFNDGYLSSVSFNDCNFTMNTVTKKLINDSTHNTFKHYESGKGVFACASFSVFISGRTIFNYNQGSAMYLSSCKIHFESGSHVSFTNNSGYDGGAIIFLGASVLYIKDNSTMTFVNNTAVRRGGAIMYFSNNEHDYFALRNCFIQYLGQNPNVNERKIQLNFTDNKAVYGQAIFASTLKPCQRLCILNKQVRNWTSYLPNHTESFLGCIGNFTISNNTENAVSTSGERLVSDSNYTGSEVIPVTPGQELWLEFNMSDELSQSTYDTFHVSIESKTSREANISIDPAYTYVEERKVVKLYGRPGEKAEVVLTNAEFQPITVIATVLMKHCPPGFVLSEDTNEITWQCVCSAETKNKRYVGITSCSSQKKVAYLRRSYWIGYKNQVETEDELITGQCPRGFCKSYISKSSSLFNEYELPNNASISDLDSYICDHHRTGKLCGRCRPNHSVFFHSRHYHCHLNNHTCKVSLILYFISELLPVTVLFLVIIVFDIRFTSGSLNSLLFYIQMIDALIIEVKGIIEPHKTVGVMMKANQLLYRFFNLEFFTLDNLHLSFCMWSTASTLDILAFKYVTITYSLLLIIVTVLLMKFFNPWVIKKCCVCKIKNKKFSAKTSVVHGLVAFLVICYAQITYVSISILTPGHIHSIGSHHASTVAYYGGDMPFMKQLHLKYAIPAIIFTITFTIIPPLLLIVYPLCYKVFALLRLQESSCVQVLCMLVPLEKLKPLLDSFQGCFKDNYRFFAGLFFIYRLLALTNYAVTDSLTLFYTLLEIQLVITLIIHAVVQPYKQRWHNIIDILLLGLLALINAMTMYNYQNAYRDRVRFEADLVNACQVFFAFLPVIYLVVYGAMKTIKRITRVLCMKREVENRDQDLTDTLTMVDMRERSYSESGSYHRF